MGADDPTRRSRGGSSPSASRPAQIRTDYQIQEEEEPFEGPKGEEMGGGFKAQVRLGDVRPSERNPRKDFGDIDALARSIEATGGEPVNPMVLVRDGNVYRIVDGERRFRALSRIHGEDDRVGALVFTDYGEAASVVAMVATDDKMRLTPEEQATGFQQMMVLDVDEEVAAKAVGRDVDQVRRARRSLRDTGATQATLDTLILAGDDEFSEGERMEIVNAGQRDDDWSTPATKANDIRRAHKALRKLENLKRASIEYHDGTRPSDMEGYAFVGSCDNAKEADEIYAYGTGFFHAWWNRAPLPSGWVVWRKLKEGEEAPRSEDELRADAEREERDRQFSLYKDARCEMMGWLLDSLGPFADARDAVPATCDAVIDSRRDLDASLYDMDTIMVSREEDVIRCSPSWYEVVRWLDERCNAGTWWSTPFGMGGWAADKFATAWDALVADGWEPPKALAEVREACGGGKE